MRRKGNPHALLVGMQTGAATVERSMEVPQKIKNGTALWPSDSTSGNSSKKSWHSNLKECKHPYVHCSVICNWQNIEAAKCPSVDEWIKQLWHIYTIEYCSNIKKKKILPFAIAWTNLQSTMLSEISQSEKDEYHMISLICGI